MLEAGESRFSVTEGLCQAVGMLADAVVKRTSGARHRTMDFILRFFEREIISGGRLDVIGVEAWSLSP
jgi:hypothetical protein